MRVLVVSHASSVWGAQLRLLETAPRLAERGVTLVLGAPVGSRLPDDWTAAGLEHVPLDLPVHRGLRRDDGSRVGPAGLAREAAAIGRSALAIARVARSYDALLSFSLWAHLETAVAGRLTGVPVVMEVVDLVSPGLGQRSLRLAGRLASTVVVNSAATGATLGPDVEVEVVHPGVDLERYRPGPADPSVRASLGGVEGAPLVGIIGRVDPRKGVDTVIEAMGRSAHGDARLAVVGDVGIGTQEHVEGLRRRATALLGDRVRFAGRRDDVADVHRALDVLVNASVAEPFGRSVLEAQASGTPVVGTASGGIPEFVADGATGLLVPPGDPAALAAAIDRLLGDPSLAGRLGAAGRRQAEAGFALVDRWDAHAALYRALPVRSTGRPRRRLPGSRQR